VGARGRRPLWSPCVKSRSQNWDPTSWKSRPKSFQVSILETASVKIQAPKLRSQVLKTMSWKPYPKISQPQRMPGRSVARRGGCRAEPGRPSVTDLARHPHSRRECWAGPGRLSVTDPSSVTDRRSELALHHQHYDLPTYQMLGRFCRWIKMQNCRVRQTNTRTDYLNLYKRCTKGVKYACV